MFSFCPSAGIRRAVSEYKLNFVVSLNILERNRRILDGFCAVSVLVLIYFFKGKGSERDELVLFLRMCVVFYSLQHLN